MNLTLQLRASIIKDVAYFFDNYSFYNAGQIKLQDLKLILPMGLEFAERWAESSLSAEEVAEKAKMELSVANQTRFKNQIKTLKNEIEYLKSNHFVKLVATNICTSIFLLV